ncbi:MAG TPA: LysR family transcriptional regulator [Polyangiaceae bacterium]|jgi:DNA-binding transcriptional LysR family regulator|nr:LysR family transcriptional regulator [Polyangiaceae bacterium]
MPDMDLNDVAAFVRVVENSGFAKAARELGVPTSTVSRAVARLEESVGVRLLHRTTRNLSVTSEGHAFHQRVAPLVASLRDATRTLGSGGKEPEGLLRVTAPNDIGSAFLSEEMVRFAERYPLLRVEVMLTNRKLNLVSEGLDVAVRAGRLEASSLVARKIGTLQVELYASPAYAERSRLPSNLVELARHKIVAFGAHDGKISLDLDGPRGAESVELNCRIACDDFGFVRATLVAGGGIGLIPRMIAASEVATGRLVRVLPEYTASGGALYVIYPTARQVPTKVTLFRDFLAKRCAETMRD